MANDDLWPVRPTNPNVGPAVFRRGAGKMRNKMAGQMGALGAPAAGADGTGGSGGWMPCPGCCGIVNSCCSGLPTVMHGTWSAPGCACVDGAVTTFTNTDANHWAATATTKNFDLCDQVNSTFSFTIRCNSGSWFLDMFATHSGTSGQTSCDFTTIGFVAATSAQCSPLQLVFNGTLSTTPGNAACPCAGQAWTLTVTV